ncbi:hypothetical protein Pint_35144 [Pistacia integerrima]|uniref:Uncharacterized protein n=1 Tax=Pistacia integerrima TaxID=434235 RepID=A0ACC0Y3T1_9ROSI|nr:hypothetical protein Pint_35144 [Pistacia integerrima]
MAYRRRQGITKTSTFKEEIYHPPDNNSKNINNSNENNKASVPTFKTSHSFSPSTQSLAAQAIRASAAHRDSSLSSAYAADPPLPSETQRSKSFTAYEGVSARNDSKGFWGVLARKAKAILEDEELSPQAEPPARSRWQMSETSAGGQVSEQPFQSSEGTRNLDNPRLRRGLDRITSSLNQIGDTFEKAFEEGRTIVENKTADIIQETRKLHTRRKGSTPEDQNQISGANSTWQPVTPTTQSQNQTYHETQLKASRDVRWQLFTLSRPSGEEYPGFPFTQLFTNYEVFNACIWSFGNTEVYSLGYDKRKEGTILVAMATAAKAKLLLRELKTVKADLAFAKQRCTQLEDENKLIRESREKGQNPADDDLIRLQLETLLAEKARLANENSIYARENRFLREIVEYHQLTMQDVVYLDEGTEEVTEVYPISIAPLSKMFSDSPPSPTSPSSPSKAPPSTSLPNPSSTKVPEEVTKEIFLVQSEGRGETLQNDVPTNPPSTTKVPEEDDAKKPSESSV